MTACGLMQNISRWPVVLAPAFREDALDFYISGLFLHAFQAEDMLALQYRWNVYKNIRQQIDENEGGMDKFTQGTSHFPVIDPAALHHLSLSICWISCAPYICSCTICSRFKSAAQLKH